MLISPVEEMAGAVAASENKERDVFSRASADIDAPRPIENLRAGSLRDGREVLETSRLTRCSPAGEGSAASRGSSPPERDSLRLR